MRRLGNYELIDLIGRGGMAEVWRGRRMDSSPVSKTVAIKVMAGSLAADDRARAMFRSETELSRLLTHSNIVQVFDWGMAEREHFLVMEWVDGINLSVLLENMRERGAACDPPLALYIISELLHALDYAHTIEHEGAPLDVVHRDISPQNLLMSTSGEIKLTDFGVARFSLEDSSGLYTKGKLRYMAPEQFLGGELDARTDIYAVGAILYECLSGQKFRPARDEAHMCGMAASGELPQLNLPVSPEVRALLDHLLAPQLTDRVASARAALEEIARIGPAADGRSKVGDLVRRATGVVGPRSGVGSSGSFSGAERPPSGSTQLHGGARHEVPNHSRATITRPPDSAAPGIYDMNAPHSGVMHGSVSQFGTMAYGPGLDGYAAPNTVADAPRSSWPARLGWAFGVFGLGAAAFVLMDGPTRMFGDHAGSAATVGVGPGSNTSPVNAGGGTPQRPGQVVWAADSSGPVPGSAPTGSAPGRLDLVADAAGPPGGHPQQGGRTGQVVGPSGVTGTTVSAAQAADLVIEDDPADEPVVDRNRTGKDRVRKANNRRRNQKNRRNRNGRSGSSETRSKTRDPKHQRPGADLSGQSGGSSKVEPEPKLARPVTIDLKAHQFGYVYVRFAGRSVLLEPLKRITAVPGKYVLSMRESPDDPWQRVQPVVIKSGFRYELRMKRPLGVSITPIRLNKDSWRTSG